LVTDLEGTIQEANRAAAVLLGMKHGLAGGKLSGFIDEADRAAFGQRVSKLAAGIEPRIEDLQVSVPSGKAGSIPISFRAELVRDRDGRAAGLRWLMSDVTPIKRIEEERAQIRLREHIARAEIEAAKHLEFLAEASAVLASSLDTARILASIARLPVPYL